MLSDRAIQDIALFYYLSLSGEGLAYRLTYETVRRLENKKWETLSVEEKNQSVVSSCFQAWEKNRLKKPQYSPLIRKKWNIPLKVNTSVWRQFQRHVDKDWLPGFVFHKVLKYSSQEVSLALGITEGALRFRVEKSLRLLSYYNSFGEFEL